MRSGIRSTLYRRVFLHKRRFYPPLTARDRAFTALADRVQRRVPQSGPATEEADMKIAFALAVVLAAVAAAPALAAKPSMQGYRWITDAPQPTKLITDTLAPGGGTSQQPVTVSVDRKFAWSDAGIGALATAGLLSIVLGGTVLVRQRVRPAV
jgi:hypothetical protein